jgi:hypothetical protein
MAIHEPYLAYYSKFEDVDETRKFLGNVAEFYKNDSVNEGCKKLNSMMRYYVYRKLDDETKQKGGNDNIPDFSDNSKFVTPTMNGYDNEYSYINSIHHIMKNHKIIPKTVSPEKFCKDIGISLSRDSEVDNKLKSIAKSVVISHSVVDDKTEKESVETVLDGINVFLIERDCNDNYDIDLIKKSSTVKSNDKAVILMKEGTWYVPVYYLDDESQKRVGMFDMKHDVIKQMLENV